eukprot:CAMPEP_0170992962 /NCGR_PEP_ID=MMETSP0736-20130129/10051_1 /TAXON_ID=186038 /ORGANISM="Fragilariopsis kerguelensis, Strain L26-C5" /LENGTH=763 /DNA_ID=CAMNT_0011418511 /DNA_START=67 /DNA_END=2358 /DNA_ORIENTATION=+
MASIHPMSAATSWTREPQQATLYSDWKVSFTTAIASTSKSNKHNDTTDTGSVSTASLTAFDDGHTIDEGDNTDVYDECTERLISSTPLSSSSSSSSSHASHEEEEEQQQQHPKKQEVSYAVHRNMLGPRSAYFTKSFISARISPRNEDSSCAGSVIQLPSTLAPQAFRALVDAFEVLLDYCYNNNSISENCITTKLTTENAVAMYCLCTYFEMNPEVSKMIQAFIAKDLNQQTIATYYQSMKDLRSSITSTTTSGGFTLLNVQPLHDMVAFLCYKHPTILSATDFLTKVADAALWLSIGALLAARNTKNDDDSSESINKNKAMEKESKVWSKYLTAFFDTTAIASSSGDCDVAAELKNVLERKETFRILTTSEVLPVISKRVALRLLQHERRLYGLVDKTKEVDKDDTEDDNNLWASDDADDDACNLSSSSPSNTTKNGRDDLDSMIRFCANDDSVLTQNEDSTTEEKEEQQQQQSVQQRTTSLQRRCIQALASSNWSGKENDVELLRGSGTLTHMTTPIVLEELLIGSVIGERKLGTQLTALQAEAHVQKQVQSDENIQIHEQLRTLEVVVIKKGQKNYQLAKVVKHEATKREGVERNLATFHVKVEEETKRLISRHVELEKKLKEEQKRSYSFDLRYKACESSRRKTEKERKMFELTCTETVSRLEALSNQQAWLHDACGVFSPFLMMFSTRSDRRECEKIKAMLQQVIEDPLSYERYFWLKSIGAEGDGDDDDTVGSDCDEDDDCTFFSDDTNGDHSIMS